MFKLIPYELGKIWRKKSFIALTALLLAINAFMLWYLNNPRGDETPPLSAYKSAAGDLSGKSLEEQKTFLTDKADFLNNMEIVERYISLMQYNYSDMDEQLQKHLEAERETYRKIYEEFKDVYETGSYLSYTKNLQAEQKFVEEILAECETVAGYDDYIKSIEENKNRLSGISIFGQSGVDKNSFSARNIEKSYLDHKNLTSKNIRFTPSKGVKIASENMLTDLFLILSVMLVVGSLIIDEKEKGLFYVTRATRNGIVKCIAAKLFALLIQSAAIVLLLYGSNFLYAEFAAGVGDLGASIHSVSMFQESSVDISLGGYLMLGFLTKTALLFSLGAALTAASIVTSRSFAPMLCGVGFLGISYAAFKFIPAYSKFNPLKYLSFWGVFNPKYIYGEYLNFNIGGYPFERIHGAVIVCAAAFLTASAVCVLLFINAKSLDIRRVRISFPLFWKLRGNLFLHESAKILFTNKAIVVLVIFGVLLGGTELKKSYYPTLGEQYYAKIMHELEGELTEEKEQYILDEKARFDRAFEQIDRINEMCANGEIDERTAKSMISVWEAQTVLYPYFQRVEERYDAIKSNGGEFVYETGYRLLFGSAGGGYLTDMFMQILCVVFAFSGVMSIEHRFNSWNLISATAKGKKKIIANKALCCVVLCAAFGGLPWIFRVMTITKTFTLNLAETSVKNLPMYVDFPVGISIWLFVAFAVLLQIIVLLITCAGTLVLSYKLKNNAAAVFGGLLVFAAAPALAVMGMSAAQWFSLYPLYSLPALI